MPSMETSVALEVCHVRVADCPFSIVSGLTEIAAVGDAGGGGGGGGGGAAFFAQAPSIRIAARAMTVASGFKICFFMLFLSTLSPPANPECVEFRRNVLFPTPVWLRVTSSKRQLMKLGAVGQHHPDFLLAGTAGLKNEMPAVWRPRWRIVPSAIVSELHPLLAGDVHQIDVAGTGLARTILPGPCQGEELAVGRPTGRDSIALIGHALLVGAIGLDGIDLRQSGAAADEGDLRTGLAIPDGRNIGALAGGHAVKVSTAGVANINFGIPPARGRESKLRSIRRPRGREIGAAEMGEAHQTVEVEGEHHNVPSGFG